MPSQIDSNQIERAESAFSLWFNKAQNAYVEDDKGELVATYLDDGGNLKEGIYFAMPNDVYHSLDALSSSKLKGYVASPTEYAYEHIFDIQRDLTSQQKRTFLTGTLIHELVLEPVGFFQKYFLVPVQREYPNALNTIEQINRALEEAGLPISEGKKGKLNRLLRHDPNVDTQRLVTNLDIDNALVARGLPKSESKLDKALRLHEVAPDVEVFDVILQKALDAKGKKTEVEIDGDMVALYGGMRPVDSVMWHDTIYAAQAVRQHEGARKCLSDGFAEVTFISRCSITGLLLKAKFDWLTIYDTASDVKSAASTDPRKFGYQVNDLNYDVQEQFYCYVAEMLGVNIREFYFIAVRYNKAINCQPYRLRPQKRLQARKVMINALQSMSRRLDTNNWANDYEEPVVLEI